MKTINHTPLCRPNAVALAVCAALAALGTPALAEPLQQVTLYRTADMSRWSDNYIELGAAFNAGMPNNSSFKFGEFSGLNGDGLYGVLGFNWITRDEQNDAKYSQVYGENVGLSGKFLLDAGEQGRWRMLLGVDTLTRSETDSAKFIHDGLGTNNLTLSAGCSNFLSATAVASNCLHNYDIKQDRGTYRLGVSGLLSNGWNYQVNFREDLREGTRLTGIYGMLRTAPPALTLGSSARAMTVPYPIDDHTQQMETLLSYGSKAAQFQLGYSYSRYVNDVKQLDVASPFTDNVPMRLSLMPSNDFHQVQATGGYNFGKVTRVAGKVSYSVGRQNDPFLPYTTNASALFVPMPRSSLNGKVVNTLVDISLMTKPVEKMNLRLGVQYRNNDNQTPTAQYFYPIRDGVQLDPATLAANSPSRAAFRTNAPISTSEKKGVVDADYEIAARTLLRTMVEYTNINYQPTDRTYTNTAKATVELRRPVSAQFLGNLGYTYTQRKGSDYDKNVFFRSSYSDPSYQSNFKLDNHPSTRSFMYSDFSENRVRTSGTWTASEQVTVQGGVDAYHQRYRGPGCAEFVDGINATAGLQANEQLPDTCLGRSFAEGGSANFDLQWQLEENFATFAFANIAQTKTQLHGRQWTRLNASTPPTGTDERRDFFDDLIYRDIAVGLGVKFQPEKWDLGAQYVYNRGVGKSQVSVPANSTSAAPVPLPDSENRVHSVQLYAKWNYSKEVTWRFNYWVERLMSSDWAYDGLTPTSTANILLTGQGSPNYWNHVVGVSVAFSNW
jgi:MtrB/PioB family decaheme-associated outer membrane protein